MIYVYAKILDNQNDDYIYENPTKNNWGLIKDGITLAQLPTRKDLVQYRQCLFANEAFTWLVNTFEIPVNVPNLFYTLGGYTNDSNKQTMLNIAKQILAESKILVYFDICADKENDEWLEIKEAFIAKYPADYNERIFAYSKVFADKNVQKQIIDKLLEQENKQEETNENV